jgi:hypothetical protein
MKAYTDIEQSQKLAEILPLESADMFYTLIDQGLYLEVKQGIEPSKDDIPCWSLAALLEVLPKIYLLKPILDLEENSILYSGTNFDVKADNIIDACVEMIVKLHELKVL